MFLIQRIKTFFKMLSFPCNMLSISRYHWSISSDVPYKSDSTCSVAYRLPHIRILSVNLWRTFMKKMYWRSLQIFHFHNIEFLSYILKHRRSISKRERVSSKIRKKSTSSQIYSDFSCFDQSMHKMNGLNRECYNYHLSTFLAVHAIPLRRFIT